MKSSDKNIDKSFLSDVKPWRRPSEVSSDAELINCLSCQTSIEKPTERSTRFRLIVDKIIIVFKGQQRSLYDIAQSSDFHVIKLSSSTIHTEDPAKSSLKICTTQQSFSTGKRWVVLRLQSNTRAGLSQIPEYSSPTLCDGGWRAQRGEGGPCHESSSHVWCSFFLLLEEGSIHAVLLLWIHSFCRHGTRIAISRGRRTLCHLCPVTSQSVRLLAWPLLTFSWSLCDDVTISAESQVKTVFGLILLCTCRFSAFINSYFPRQSGYPLQSDRLEDQRQEGQRAGKGAPVAQCSDRKRNNHLWLSQPICFKRVCRSVWNDRCVLLFPQQEIAVSWSHPRPAAPAIWGTRDLGWRHARAAQPRVFSVLPSHISSRTEKSEGAWV